MLFKGGCQVGRRRDHRACLGYPNFEEYGLVEAHTCQENEGVGSRGFCSFRNPKKSVPRPLVVGEVLATLVVLAMGVVVVVLVGPNN